MFGLPTAAAGPAQLVRITLLRHNQRAEIRADGVWNLGGMVYGHNRPDAVCRTPLANLNQGFDAPDAVPVNHDQPARVDAASERDIFQVTVIAFDDDRLAAQAKPHFGEAGDDQRDGCSCLRRRVDDAAQQGSGVSGNQDWAGTRVAEMQVEGQPIRNDAKKGRIARVLPGHSVRNGGEAVLLANLQKLSGQSASSNVLKWRSNGFLWLPTSVHLLRWRRSFV